MFANAGKQLLFVFIVFLTMAGENANLSECTVTQAASEITYHALHTQYVQDTCV